jgi:isocitrate dehydrogenase (NAD+)
MKLEVRVHQIVLIEGDGIGPEVVNAAVAAIDATGVKIKWEPHALGLKALEQYKTPVPDSTIEAIKRAGVALKGPTTTPVGGGHKSANVALRQALDLYACIRPVKSLPGVETRFSDVDLIIVRENTEGLYCGQEIQVSADCAISLRIMTEQGCTRIAKAAFELARTHGRKSVCAVHKANILKLGDGLFLNAIRKVRESYPELEYQEAIVDALCMRMVSNPVSFDVLVSENMFGDILSDLTAGLVGGLGIVPGANIGDGCAVFEAVHGSAPDIAGLDLANPTAMMQTGVMLLNHIGEKAAAARLSQGITQALGEKSSKTKDLGGQASTTQFTHTVVNFIKGLG